MNGPEHYRAAEDLAHDARLILEQQSPNGGQEANAGASALAALAQVHATLASIPQEHLQIWESFRQVFLDRITTPRSVDTFRRVWAEADARGESGSRVEQALAAVVSEVLL